MNTKYNELSELDVQMIKPIEHIYRMHELISYGNFWIVPDANGKKLIEIGLNSEEYNYLRGESAVKNCPQRLLKQFGHRLLAFHFYYQKGGTVEQKEIRRKIHEKSAGGQWQWQEGDRYIFVKNN